MPGRSLPTAGLHRAARHITTAGAQVTTASGSLSLRKGSRPDQLAREMRAAAPGSGVEGDSGVEGETQHIAPRNAQRASLVERDRLDAPVLDGEGPPEWRRLGVLDGARGGAVHESEDHMQLLSRADAFELAESESLEPTGGHDKAGVPVPRAAIR